MKSTPVEGMKDYLPEENALREELIRKITEVYTANGYRRIATPIVETLENLDNSDGGENLKLIYRIEKRGEKLEKALAAGDAKKLCDLGLRYDLTLPLARYYTAHSAELPVPFKCIQIDRVYRAERPQKGRMREFIQCDIDILGSESLDCEAELMTVTAAALRAIGIGRFHIAVNHRAVIRSVILAAGFPDEAVNSVCISMDKLDKIGADGVKAELLDKGFAPAPVDKLAAILADPPTTAEGLKAIGAGEAADELFAAIEAA
ncbi:MAG: ATP phosphoribosyltransferase regulatory subunit, partial [Eubacterium sp.]|nr:ATP phosphoribosyltransferase regulatory subunit [Eubacterium sp.]